MLPEVWLSKSAAANNDAAERGIHVFTKIISNEEFVWQQMCMACHRLREAYKTKLPPAEAIGYLAYPGLDHRTLKTILRNPPVTEDSSFVPGETAEVPKLSRKIKIPLQAEFLRLISQWGAPIRLMSDGG